MIVCRGKFPMNLPSEKYMEWHKDASKQLSCQVPILTDSLTLTFFVPDKRAGDLTNKAESVMDLLVDMNIIEDDNWYVISNINLRFGGVDKENPRCEISY